MLSRETLISMLKNEYPESYNSHDIDNMGVKELDDLLDFLDSMKNKANGGMMIAIEQLGQGGVTGGKTYHQYHDSFVPRDEESMGYANGGGVGSMMQPKKNFKMQGGVRNYLGKQKEVKAPLNWQSSPDHPKTELAYITQKEKDLLVNQDLHNSLKGGVNRGPSGIMSLNGWGSTDPKQNVSGATASAAESGKHTSDTLAAGMSNQDVQDFRNAFIAAGGGQRVNPGFFDSRNTVSADELAAAKASNPAAFAAGRRGTGLLGFLGGGGILGALVRGLGQKFGWGKKYDESTYDMSEFNNYGLGGSKNPDYYNDLGNEIALGTTGVKKNVTPPGWTIQDEMVDVSNYNTTPSPNFMGVGPVPPVSGIMKAGGFSYNNNPYQSGSVKWNPAMGAAPMGLQYPGGEPNYIQDRMEQDAGMYTGLPNQKLVNDAAMEVFKKGFRNANWDMPQGSPGMLNPEPLTSMMPDPANDLFAFAPGSIKDKQIKQAWNAYQETGFGKENLEKLMKEDLESGGELSLDKSAYSMIS